LLCAKLQKFPPNEKKTKQNTKDNLHGWPNYHLGRLSILKYK
jgi:hypothetical protein